MKIYELIDFVSNHTKIARLVIESCFEGDDPRFEGSVVELLESQYMLLHVHVENATYDSVNATLHIFYDEEQ